MFSVKIVGTVIERNGNLRNLFRKPEDIGNAAMLNDGQGHLYILGNDSACLGVHACA